MQEQTVSLENTRFGSITMPLEQVLQFESGLIGLPKSRRYALLSLNPQVYWLQSLDEPEIALPMIPASNFSSNYWEIAGLAEASEKAIQANEEKAMAFLVLTVNSGKPASLNLRAPILIDPERAIGCQILLDNMQLPMEMELTVPPANTNAQAAEGAQQHA